MKYISTDIYQVNDSFFHKIIDTPGNARDFMERVLPIRLKNQLDLANIEIEDTKYVSNQFRKGFSDIVVKTSLKTKKGKKKSVDIYFIIEHKTEGRAEIFIQVLKYMVFEWEKDYNNNKLPRIIIPVVFYHGADQWKVPLSFADQFDVEDELKPFLLDYRYVLFDTNTWDFRDDSKISGGEIMPTLAQQFREEFMQTLGPQLKDEGKKEGMEEKAKETAKELIKRGIDLDIIEAAAGLSREELKKIEEIAQ
jgi:hypothetical protein